MQKQVFTWENLRRNYLIASALDGFMIEII